MALRVGIVGSGPAGFYSASQILKHQFRRAVDVHVDMFEAMPVPYGLVRYGVAPDHPEVKHVQHRFEQIASDGRFAFHGNVRLGNDVTLDELRSRYDALVLAYGAAKDRRLNVPGEDLKNVFSARAFVGWYNGYPALRNLGPSLTKHDTAVIVGHGNVALDVARILLTPVDVLAKTDMPDYALEALRTSTIRRVHLVGRRGPINVKFSAKELRELYAIPNVRVHHDTALVKQEVELHQSKLDRQHKRILSLMDKPHDVKDAQKEAFIDFYKKPLDFQSLPSDSGTIGVARFESTDPKSKNAIVSVPCGLVVKSIGYQIDPVPGLPFDAERGHVANTQGRITNLDGTVIPGLYCAGWLKRGPTGVIVTTMYDAFQTADCIVHDIEDGRLSPKNSGKVTDTATWLRSKSVRSVSFEDWKRVEEEEKRRGEVKGKTMEKFVSVEAIFKVLDDIDKQKK